MKLVSLFSILAGLAATSPSSPSLTAAQLPASGLVAAWTFDEVAALASPQRPPSAGSLPTGPLPGDVFREYSWTTEKFHVFSLKTNLFALPANVDLKDAIRAEVVVELANQHMGFEGMTICLNGKQWYPIPFPASSPKDPSPSLWFHHWYPTIPIALTDLKEGNENTVEMKVPAECYDGKIHPNGNQPLVPWCPLYGVTVRVYYDPARKPHPTGKVVIPTAQSCLGLAVELAASAKSDNGPIRQVDFLGRYEDINYEGDGVYDQWHGHLFHGKITHHLGSTTQPEGKVTWDTSWVPDQAGPMEIAARITDNTGLTYMTEAVGGLKLVRPGLSVELCKPLDVPRSFTGCQYGEWVISGVRTQKFRVKGDLSKATEARYVIASWGNQKECPGYTINGVALQDQPGGRDYTYNLALVPIRPLTVLKAGENTFATVVAKGRMPDIYMPGVQVLIRYRTSDAGAPSGQSAGTPEVAKPVGQPASSPSALLPGDKPTGLPHPAKPASTPAPVARWRPETTDWSRATDLVIGDWGFNRPGYPEGLYIHGVTRPAGEKVINPVIYDNDVYDDVFDDELAFVMASEGEMNLVGLIVTPVLTDFWGFSKPGWIKTAHDSRRNAELSGLRRDRIPPITIGTEAPSEKAGENKDSAGARLYVQLINEQFDRDPQRPLIVNIGGQGATLASAHGLDPAIAHKCIVYYTDLRVYNGHYQWASKLIAAHFRVVSWGDDNWWITKPAQNQWRVLPRPEKAEGKENDQNSGEWRQLTELRVPLLDHIVKQFQTRGEYCQGPKKGDGYLDGTFLHAWLPGIFSGAALKDIRGGQVLHVTRFTAANEDRVKTFANARLLNPQAYRRAPAAAPPAAATASAVRSVNELRVTVATNVVDVYDFVEVTLQPEPPLGGNPFTDAGVEGEFSLLKGGTPLKVDGFCDSPDGSDYKIRFMPAQAGDYKYTVTLRQGEQAISRSGTFTARRAWRRGVLRVDPKQPFHFIWEGTGEHYFWNGTTTYYLMGWQSDEQIRKIIDRLSDLKINRLRVLIYGRNEDRPWGQPVKSTDEFKLYLNPWLAQRPDDVKDPGFDLRRFNVAYWQRYERMLAYARQKGIVISVIPFIGAQVLPTPFAAFSEEEQLYYRYAVARLSAFGNITWDLGNEHDLNRKQPGWADWLGPLVKQWDPYDHLLSAHNRIYRTPGNPWNDMQLIQRWDAGQTAFLIEQRRQEAASGRPVPLIIEEYGYEDLWEKKPGDRSAESRRKVAWEVCMAGCYQTTGETANRGTGFPPDSGGGWVNGRGDDSMTMLKGYAHMVGFFTSFDWWRAEPHNELVEAPVTCLAEPGQLYALYLPSPKQVTVKLAGPASYRARWFNPRTGEWSNLPDAAGPQWTAPMPLGEGDWVLFLTAYDWRTDAWKSYFNHDGLQYNNNRWAGEQGSMFVRFGPPTATWWTTHSGNRHDFPVSAPWVGVGNDWGNISKGSPFPIKLGELEILKASLSSTLPPAKTNQMYKIYWQLYFSDAPTGKFNKGDFAPTVYAVRFPANHWGADRGSATIDGRQWRFQDQQYSSGMGRYIIPMLEPLLKPDANRVVEIREVDIKALIDWCIAKGYYSPDDYCMVIGAGWEIFALDEDLRMNDMAFTIKQKGKPAVTIPAWTTLMSKQLGD